MSAVRMTLKLQQRPWSVATVEGVKVATTALSTCRNDIQVKGTKFSWSRSRSRRFGTLTTNCSSLFVPFQHENDYSHTPLVNRRFSSTSASPIVEDNDSDGPGGDLFNAAIGLDLVGKTAYIRRTFGSRSNAQCFLVCGGEALAKHASFDPDYDRAQGWIRHHAVGPAVLSPVLISGLVGALVEAALPQSVPVSSSMKQIRPLIVGVEVCAKIEVTAVYPDGALSDNDHTSTVPKTQDDHNDRQRQHGYQIELKTLVSRVQDDVSIAEGHTTVWIPDYLHM